MADQAKKGPALPDIPSFPYHLNVFREIQGRYERVGRLLTLPANTLFTYDPAYLSNPNAQSISLSLPLQPEPFSRLEAPGFFEGLLPEGSFRNELAHTIHVDQHFSVGMLARLNNESVGGLVFGREDSFLPHNRGYTPLSYSDLAAFSGHPDRTAIAMITASRLSLSGAQTKAGLYHQEGADIREGWFLPEGSAPSNTIVKISRDTFPLQTLNEAFCLIVARICGFDAASPKLIPLPSGLPLIAVPRFDRVIPEAATLVDGLLAPARLHQEDFCQAAGMPSHRKYEPTDGHYVELGSRIIGRTSSNPFGDKMMFMNRILFDFLIGNCDNHLKNHSIVWSADWKTRELSPLYDITCTTMYPPLDREMGVSLCPSRRIEDVAAQDIRSAFRRVGISEELGWNQYLNLCEELQAALAQARQELINQGFPQVREVAQFVAKDSNLRCHLR